MAQIIIDIADADETRVLRRVAEAYGWTSTSPMNRKQYAKAMLAQHVANLVRGMERAEREAAALAAVADDPLTIA